MEIFTVLKAPPLLNRPTPFSVYKDVRAIDEAKMAEIVNINVLHEAVKKVHTEVEKNSTENRTTALKWRNSTTNVLPLNISISYHVMTRTHAKCRHKFQYKWRGPMLVKEAKSSPVFVLKYFINAEQMTVHAHSMLIYHFNKTSPCASEELKQQAIHYDSTYHLVDEIHDIRKDKNEFQVLIRWSGLSEDLDMT